MEKLVGRPTAEIPAYLIYKFGGSIQFQAGLEYPDRFVRSSAPEIEVMRHDWVQERQRLSGAKQVHLISRITHNGNYLQMPMVDVQLGARDPNVVRSNLSELLHDLAFPDGFISQTESGYQFVGTQLVNYERFDTMLDNLLKVASQFPSLNRQWVEDARINGYATLAVSGRRSSAIVPMIVSEYPDEPNAATA